MEKIKVPESELSRLLNDPDADPDDIGRYFEVEFDAPFDGYLKLKPEVEVIPERQEEVTRGMVQNLVVSLANNWARNSRNKLYKRMIAQDPEAPRLISEGDSWFQHPHPKVLDIIDQLMNHYPIYSMGAAGDTLRNMFYEGEFVRAMRYEKPRIFLLSGGGNDILGSQFREFLVDTFTNATPGSDPHRFLKSSFTGELESIGKVYTRVFKKLKDAPIDLVVHGYDYVIPWNTPDKGWLGRYMLEKHIDNADDRAAIIRFMIDGFNDMLRETASSYTNVHYIDLRNTVRNDQWYDEIHPTSEGYQDVALKFHEVIEEILKKRA